MGEHSTFTSDLADTRRRLAQLVADHLALSGTSARCTCGADLVTYEAHSTHIAEVVLAWTDHEDQRGGCGCGFRWTADQTEHTCWLDPHEFARHMCRCGVRHEAQPGQVGGRP